MINIKPVENAEGKMIALKASQSPVTLEAIRTSIVRELEGLPIDFDKDVTMDLGWSKKHLTVVVSLEGIEFYDWLMDCKHTGIDAEHIWAWWSRSMVLCSHENTEVTIRYSIKCDLPKRDYVVLDMIGKIKREFKPGKMEEQVSCSI